MRESTRLRWLVGLFTVVLLAASACRAPTDEGLTQETFVAVLTELREAAALSEAGEWDARKREILDAAGVTDSMLVAYVRRHGDRLPHMLEVWDSVAERLRPPESRRPADELDVQ
ncbi:MAG TPA: hypothetical protein VMM83_05555 [Longimicrobiales bacterium]|nr:hypothetical protein [Longimicrobiales bacterium]